MLLLTAGIGVVGFNGVVAIIMATGPKQRRLDRNGFIVMSQTPCHVE